MPVCFHIPGPLQALADGRRTIELDNSPASLREALEVLFSLYPGLRDRILSEQGSVREHVNLFVGREDVRYLHGLETKLDGASEILIIPAVSGGCFRGSFRSLSTLKLWRAEQDAADRRQSFRGVLREW